MFLVCSQFALLGHDFLPRLGCGFGGSVGIGQSGLTGAFPSRSAEFSGGAIMKRGVLLRLVFKVRV